MLKDLKNKAMPVAVLLAIGLNFGVLAQTNKTVTIVVGEEPGDIDSCNLAASHTGRIISQNVVETLGELMPDGSIEPRLATGWEQLNPLTWRYKIREGVTFHDGAVLNADVVVRSLERIYGATSYVCNVKSKYFDNIKMTAKKVDEYTVDFVTETPWPVVPIYLTAMAISSPKTPINKAQLTAVGTGPYTFGHWTQQQELVLKKNPDYWNKAKKLEVETARYVFRRDSSVQAAMVAIGEADLAPSISSLDANNPKTDVSYLNAETSMLRIDTLVPPLNDVRIRKAFNYALDRRAFLGTLFPKGVVLAAQSWGPNIAGHNFEIDKRIWPYDPNKARQLIAEAKADGVKVDTEIELQGRLDVYPNAQDVMEAALQSYREVGLNVKLKMYEIAQWRTLYFRPFKEGRGPALIQTSHDNATGDPAGSAPNRHTCKGGASALCDPVADKLINDAGELAGDQRVRAYQEAARYIYEDAVDHVFFVHMVNFARINPRIKYTPNILSNVKTRLEDISFN